MEEEDRRTVVKDSFQLFLPPNPPDPQHNPSVLLFIRTTGRLPRERGVGDGRIIGRDGRISGVVVATESVVWVSCSPWSMWKGSSGSLACAWACGCWSGVVEMAESRLNAGIKMADMRLSRRVDIGYGMVILVSLVQFGWYAWLVRSDGKILSCLQSRYTLSAVLDGLWWWWWSPTIFSLSRSIPGRHYHSLPSIDAKCPSHAITALLGVISRKQPRPDPSRKAYSNRT